MEIKQKSEFKELSDETFIALYTLKIAKMDYDGSLRLKGRFVAGHPYPIPFTDREINERRCLAESSYRRSLTLFKVLWQARRRLQKAVRHHDR